MGKIIAARRIAAKLNIGRVRTRGGTALSLLCLALAFKGIDFREVWTALMLTNYGFVLIAIAMVVVGVFVRAARWRLLFYPRHRKLRLNKLLAVLLIGQMTNIVIPGRFGELVRVYMLGEIERESKARVLGTIALEKAVDMLMLLFLLISLLPVMPLPRWVQESGAALVITAPSFFLTLILLAYQKKRVLLAFTCLSRFLPRLRQVHLMRQTEAALGSLDILRRWDLGLWILGWSILNWGLGAVTNYLIFLAMDVPLPFTAAIFLLLVLSLGVAVPSSPGKVGVFHYLTILTLAIFGVERSFALTYSLVLHLVVFLPPSILGAFFLWWENLSLRQLSTPMHRFVPSSLFAPPPGAEPPG